MVRGMSWGAAEKGILASYRVRDFAQCTTLAVRFAGPGIKSYLRKSISDSALLDDAYSEWSELVAMSWEKYDPAHPVASWLYVLARRPRGNAIVNGARRAVRESEFDLSLAAPSSRLETAPHVRTTVKQEFRALWEKLPPEERELLRLRIEEGLSWESVARQLRGPTWEPSVAELKLEVQKLAARYKRRVKDVLAIEAEKHGLIERFGMEP